MDGKPIERLTIKGFKSIVNLESFPLRNLNILIGSNGSGKSNFISYFRMLGELVNGRLQHWTAKNGSADRIVSFGVKETSSVESAVEFAPGTYKFNLETTVDGGFSFVREELVGKKTRLKHEVLFGLGHKESLLKTSLKKKKDGVIARPFYDAINGWSIFHFHDTSETALVKRYASLQDNERLRPDASNLAAFLYRLSDEAPDTYGQICETVRLAIPFFDDFVLQPRELDTGECQINLMWKQSGSDYVLWPSQLSDGSVRFICLVTALLQPNPPSTIIIDEPELGLHPYAVTLLGALLRSASTRMQVIVSTQSVDLVNEFSIDDLVVVERKDGATIFRREEESDFKMWLEDYTTGELWEKNVLGGRPSR
ncbi:chromosome segregation protein SMC [Synergistales bacterium]|nr:chromosome segregation protein SMC [Synergistales bacterium]